MDAKFSSYVHNILTSGDIAAYSQNPGIFTGNTSFMMDHAYAALVILCVCMERKFFRVNIAPFDIWIYIMAGHMGASTQVAY